MGRTFAPIPPEDGGELLALQTFKRGGKIPSPKRKERDKGGEEEGNLTYLCFERKSKPSLK